ncbi:UDP-glucose 6-dehydrogenase (plasmid) [Haloarcula sp. CBA1115]|nr:MULTISPECIES: nucleotide sugar dehydrogenase [Haloarcula]AJF27806.1 UDP-glucose 6-dehydrogenase [Haloarcula sp. CBA1115]KAA9404538.1 nucleotide sugar dehydrogenase [Haloarcula sp. CBA1131]
MRVCVHGLGYIGMATASLFANNGHDVVGFDTDDRVRSQLKRGEPDVSEDQLESYVRAAIDSGLTISDEPVPAAYHIICVPTPYDKSAGSADLRYVKEASQTVSSLLRPNDVVVLESTVPPSTTATVVAPILSQSGLEPGEDIGLGYVPETMLPGNAITELRSNDRILGGYDSASTAAIKNLYEAVPTGSLNVAPDATTAEFVKLVQNAFRDVNIAYANALALIARDYGVNVRDAIELANSHPRVDILNPGPGVGGHCLPVDPFFLGANSDNTDLIDTARQVNQRMPHYVVDRLAEELGPLDDKTIAILGVAYKGNVDDTRNSPGLEIARTIVGAESEAPSLEPDRQDTTSLRLCDPYVSNSRYDLEPLSDALDGADAAVLATAHDEFADLSPERVGSLLDTRVIFDTLDVLDSEAWTEAGFDLLRI